MKHSDRISARLNENKRCRHSEAAATPVLLMDPAPPLTSANLLNPVLTSANLPASLLTSANLPNPLLTNANLPNPLLISVISSLTCANLPNPPLTSVTSPLTSANLLAPLEMGSKRFSWAAREMLRTRH